MENYRTQFYDGAVGAGIVSPNALAPTAAQIISTPKLKDHSYALQVFVIDGTSLGVTVWVQDASVAAGGSGLWLQLTSVVVVSQGSPLVVAVPPGSQLFIQYGANVGPVTKLGAGFVAGGALSAATGTAGAPALPAGASTEATLALLNAKLPTAAAPADATALGTMSRVWSLLAGYNGATMDMLRSGLVAVQTTFVGILNTLPFARYNALQPTLADGNAVGLQSDSRGNLRVFVMSAAQGFDDKNGVLAVLMQKVAASGYEPSIFTNFGANATLNVKATAGNVWGFTMLNKSGGTRYFQLHNTATVPGGGAVPTIPSFMVPAGAQLVIGEDFFTESGFAFATGIAFACSTASDTYVAAAATDHTTLVVYK